MKLALVPTPIGNLEDITLRAVRYLSECDAILCEDTRYSSKLLAHLQISKPLVSYHLNNEHATLAKTILKIQSNSLTCLISDAGTPGISDPGFLLVRECLKNNIQVECLPGPTAFVPALVASGLPTEKFIFEGFLPHKKGRETRIKAIADAPWTTIMYESPHRLQKTIEQLLKFTDPNRQIVIAREISKIHEEFFRGDLTEALSWSQLPTTKGEFVVLISPA